MFFINTKGNSLSLIMATISLSGWVTSMYLYDNFLMYQLRVSEGKTINAYNILDSAFRHSISEDHMYSMVTDWVLKGSSAEVGSLTTICNRNPIILMEISPSFTEFFILKVCSVIKY
ncbi:hypothetical protein CWO08_23320 [Vibrio sp. 10N.286.48.B8]|nr:hypothetical protein A9261_21960 [Vibrio tasmaniensis]PTO87891.1 hypothetical protein CWO08_23320 [Vibrio sp. 10N.286.48.B8]PTQ04523.1 hypothetical protein CWO13_09740 [Vibrio sp. ZF 223]